MTNYSFDSSLSGSARRKARKNLSPRRTGNNGRIWVARSVIAGRRIPTQRIDPLTLPFTQRPSVIRRYADKIGYTRAEARIHLSTKN